MNLGLSMVSSGMDQCYHVDGDRVFALLYARLRALWPTVANLHGCVYASTASERRKEEQ